MVKQMERKRNQSVKVIITAVWGKWSLYLSITIHRVIVQETVQEDVTNSVAHRVAYASVCSCSPLNTLKQEMIAGSPCFNKDVKPGIDLFKYRLQDLWTSWLILLRSSTSKVKWHEEIFHSPLAIPKGTQVYKLIMILFCSKTGC